MTWCWVASIRSAKPAATSRARRRSSPGFGDGVPGVQINRFCASGLDAVNFAAAEVMSGQHEMTIGGGAESMSRIGIGASGGAWPIDPSIAVATYFLPQGISADLIATKYGFSRDDVDAYAVESQKRAAKSWDEGRFKKSVVPVKDVNGTDDTRQGRAHAAEHDHADAGRLAAVFCADGRDGAASTRSPCSAIRKSRRSIMCTRPAIPQASSTAPRRC